MSLTEKQKQQRINYAKEKLKRVPLDLQKTKYESVKSHAESRGESVNGFIKRAIDETMERDNGELQERKG